MTSPGRPSKYSAALGMEICRRMADGESLRSICRDEAMPAESTVRMWHVEDREGFSAHYTHAREAQVDRWAEEIVEIADDGSNDFMERKIGDEIVEVPNHEHMNRSRLRVDTRKWLMSKLLPKKFGDKVTNEHTGGDGGPIKLKLEFDDRT